MLDEKFLMLGEPIVAGPLRVSARFLRFPWWLLCASIASSATAQVPDLRFDRISIEEGLSQSSVLAIVQDSRGFMWFGTLEGLNRYDGYGFRVFRKERANPASLSSSNVRAIAIDPDDVLWVATDAGLNRFDRKTETFAHYRHDPEDAMSLRSDSIWSMVVDASGALFIGTDSGVDRLFPSTGEFEHVFDWPLDSVAPSERLVVALLLDRRGALWIGTDGAGLFRQELGSGALARFRNDEDDPRSLSDDHVWALYEDRSGTIWAGTDGGLNAFDVESEAFERYLHHPRDPASLSHNLVRAILEDASGRLWVGTALGVDDLDRPSRRFTNFRRTAFSDSLSFDYVRSIFQDSAGVLWFGTDGDGVNKYSRFANKFDFYRNDPVDPDSLSLNMVFAVVEDDDGSWWIGTEGGGVNLLERGSQRFTHLRHDPQDPSSLSNDIVYALHIDRRGSLWVGTAGGLDELRWGAKGFVHYRSGPDEGRNLSSSYVRTIHEDERGEIWLGTDGGVDVLDPATGRIRHYRHDPHDPRSLSNDSVTVIVEDSRGVLWIGTSEGGLNRLDEGRAGVFTRYVSKPGEPGSLANDHVRDVHEDSGGTLWVGTNGGLSRIEFLDPDRQRARFVHTRREEALPNEVVYGIEEDGSGHLWLGTNDGLVRFSRERGVVDVYNVADGLLSPEFNRGAHFETASGVLLFGTTEGLNFFQPEALTHNQHAPPVVITDVKVFNSSRAPGPPATDGATLLSAGVAETDRLVLSDDDVFVSFDFAALDYAAPSENHYAYRLRGLYDQWVELGGRHELSFAKLPAGEYQLQIRGSNNDGVWNDEGITVDLVVEPPFWGTWWFRALLGIGLLSAIGLAHYVRTTLIRQRNRELEERIRERTRELEATNKELEAFTYSVSHDLRAPLRHQSGYAQMLLGAIDGQLPDDAKRYVDKILSSSTRMANLIDELLSFSRLSTSDLQRTEIDLGRLVSEVREELEEGGAAHEVDWVVGELPTIQGDRRMLHQVFMNLMSNAVKYSRGREQPRIEVGSRDDGSSVLVYVRDNGVGFDMKYAHKLFGVFERLHRADEFEGSGIGLAIVRRIVLRHGGRTWGEGAAGKGATFYLSLPRESHV